MSKKSSHNLVWIDLELTGLNPEKDTILEVACVVTNSQLEIISEIYSSVIRHSSPILKKMDDWNTNYHTKTGLYQKVLTSKVTMKQAERELLQFIKPYTKEGKNLFAGASVHVDKLFLSKKMPLFDNYLKWQIIDVATIRNLGYRWYKAEPFKKNDVHRASDDVMESIEELKYFKALIFKQTDFM